VGLGLPGRPDSRAGARRGRAVYAACGRRAGPASRSGRPWGRGRRRAGPPARAPAPL